MYETVAINRCFRARKFLVAAAVATVIAVPSVAANASELNGASLPFSNTASASYFAENTAALALKQNAGQVQATKWADTVVSPGDSSPNISSMKVGNYTTWAQSVLTNANLSSDYSNTTQTNSGNNKSDKGIDGKSKTDKKSSNGKSDKNKDTKSDHDKSKSHDDSASAGVGASSDSDNSDMPAQLKEIAKCESSNDYKAENPESTASGKYQIIDGTWDGYKGYKHASDAPPAVQDAKAKQLYESQGSKPWNASKHCWG